METLKEIDRLLNQITEKTKARDKLLNELRQSLEIKAIWPEAFLNGSSCTLRPPTMTAQEWDQFEKGRSEVKGAVIVRIHDKQEFTLTPVQFRALHERRFTS